MVQDRQKQSWLRKNCCCSPEMREGASTENAVELRAVGGAAADLVGGDHIGVEHPYQEELVSERSRSKTTVWLGDNCMATEEVGVQHVLPSGLDDKGVGPHDMDLLALPPLVRLELSLAVEDGQGYGFGYVARADGTNTLLVAGLQPGGCMAMWNESQVKQGSSVDRTVQCGDRIVALNGKPLGDYNATSSMLKERRLRLSVERWPETFKVYLSRNPPEGKFGIALQVVQDVGTRERRLRVVEVRDDSGGAATWNRAARLAQRDYAVVTVGCEVAEVNGEPIDCERMRAKMMEMGKIELLLRRPGLRTCSSPPP